MVQKTKNRLTYGRNTCRGWMGSIQKLGSSRISSSVYCFPYPNETALQLDSRESSCASNIRTLEPDFECKSSRYKRPWQFSIISRDSMESMSGTSHDSVTKPMSKWLNNFDHSVKVSSFMLLTLWHIHFSPFMGPISLMSFKLFFCKHLSLLPVDHLSSYINRHVYPGCTI